MTTEGRDLRGEVAVVTGAGRGVGRDVAVELGTRGMRVALVGRTAADLDATAGLVREVGGAALALPADVSVPEQVSALSEVVDAELGTAVVLVNVAGIYGPLASIVESDVGEWIATQQVNLIGPYLTCRAFAPGMIDDGWGRIVNVSSSASLAEPQPFASAYSTSKTALNRFTRHLAVELEGSGVTANAVHPGSLKTEMWADIRDKVEALGEPAGELRRWVELMGETGGDSPAEAVAVVMRVILAPSSVNGGFHWPENGLEDPVPSW